MRLFLGLQSCCSYFAGAFAYECVYIYFLQYSKNMNIKVESACISRKRCFLYTILLFILAGVFKIGGGDLIWLWLRENKPAIEMANIYSNILSGTMDAYASVISNNLNIVMKFLTSVTIVMSIPTMVASFFGMNVSVPFQGNPHAFTIIFIISMFFSVILAITMLRKEMF